VENFGDFFDQKFDEKPNGDVGVGAGVVRTVSSDQKLQKDGSDPVGRHDKLGKQFRNFLNFFFCFSFSFLLSESADGESPFSVH